MYYSLVPKCKIASLMYKLKNFMGLRKSCNNFTRRVATPRKIVLILRKDMLGYKDLPFDWLVGEVKDRLEFLVNSGDVKKLAKGYRPVMDFDSK